MDWWGEENGRSKEVCLSSFTIVRYFGWVGLEKKV